MFCPPLCDLVCRWRAQSLGFAPTFLTALQKWQLGFLVFLHCVVRNLPQLCMHAVIISAYSFFVFCCWRRSLSSCKHCGEGSQVPAFLNRRSLRLTGIPVSKAQSSSLLILSSTLDCLVHVFSAHLCTDALAIRFILSSRCSS